MTINCHVDHNKYKLNIFNETTKHPVECISCRKNQNGIKDHERQTTKKGKSTIVIVNCAGTVANKLHY